MFRQEPSGLSQVSEVSGVVSVVVHCSIGTDVGIRKDRLAALMFFIVVFRRVISFCESFQRKALALWVCCMWECVHEIQLLYVYGSGVCFY